MLKLKLTSAELLMYMFASLQALKCCIMDDDLQAAVLTAASVTSKSIPDGEDISATNPKEYEIALADTNLAGFMMPLRAAMMHGATAKERNSYRRLVKRLKPLFTEYHDLHCTKCRNRMH